MQNKASVKKRQLNANKNKKFQKIKTIIKLQKIEKSKMQEIQPSRIYRHFVLVVSKASKLYAGARIFWGP